MVGASARWTTAGDGGDHHVQVAKVLSMAQEMAERLTAEAKSEADAMLTDARTKSEQLLSEARTKSDGAGQRRPSRAETMLNDARTRAETLERQSRDKAATLVGDAERKQTEIIGTHHARQVGAREEDRRAAHVRARVPHPAQDLPGVPARDLGNGLRGAARRPGQLQRRVRLHRLRPARRRRELTSTTRAVRRSLPHRRTRSESCCCWS